MRQLVIIILMLFQMMVVVYILTSVAYVVEKQRLVGVQIIQHVTMMKQLIVMIVVVCIWMNVENVEEMES